MIRSLLAGIGFAAVAVLATVLYYEGLRLPFVGQVIDGAVAHRLEGYVTLFEKTAADAKAGEEKRQAAAVSAAVGAYQRRLVESQAAETQTKTNDEKRIADYEKRLADLKRQCIADDADVDFLLRNH